MPPGHRPFPQTGTPVLWLVEGERVIPVAWIAIRGVGNATVPTRLPLSSVKAPN